MHLSPGRQRGQQINDKGAVQHVVPGDGPAVRDHSSSLVLHLQHARVEAQQDVRGEQGPCACRVQGLDFWGVGVLGLWRFGVLGSGVQGSTIQHGRFDVLDGGSDCAKGGALGRKDSRAHRELIRFCEFTVGSCIIICRCPM